MTPPPAAPRRRSLPLYRHAARSALEANRAARRAPVPVGTSGATSPQLRHATRADVTAIHRLLSQFVRRGILLDRSPDRIRADIGDYLVAVAGGRIVGCAALRIHDETLAEVCALAVIPELHGRGVGRRLVESLTAEAHELGIPRVLALTLEDGFFHRLGFRGVALGEFPQKVAADCVDCPRRFACLEIPVVHDRLSN